MPTAGKIAEAMLAPGRSGRSSGWSFPQTSAGIDPYPQAPPFASRVVIATRTVTIMRPLSLHALRTHGLIIACLLSVLMLACSPATSHADRESRWQWPTGTPVPVVSSFAPPAQDWLPGRRGVTLAYPEGSPVYACAPGTVSFAGSIAGRGVVSIRHTDGARTLWSTYLPINPSVSVGDQVDKGGVIGVVEDGSSTLHWGAKTGPKTYVNPLRLTLDRPHLLPWEGSR